jgi:hypothetical protein
MRREGDVIHKQPCHVGAQRAGEKTGRGEGGATGMLLKEQLGTALRGTNVVHRIGGPIRETRGSWSYPSSKPQTPRRRKSRPGNGPGVLRPQPRHPSSSSGVGVTVGVGGASGSACAGNEGMTLIPPRPAIRGSGAWTVLNLAASLSEKDAAAESDATPVSTHPSVRCEHSQHCDRCQRCQHCNLTQTIAYSNALPKRTRRGHLQNQARGSRLGSLYYYSSTTLTKQRR